MQTPVQQGVPTTEETTASVLIWQGRYRAVFVALIAFATITLKFFGVISSKSMYADFVEPRSLLLLVVGLVALYLAFHRGLVLYLRRTRRAGLATVTAAILSDMVMLFGATALVTPPEHFDRALIVSIFTVQFTQLFFGWSATVVNLVLIGAGYTTLIALASDAGRMPFPAEELWTLALYGIGVLALVALQGHVAKRLHHLVTLFGRAQEGDFSQAFHEESEQMPDTISVMGHAYNRMREHLQTLVLTDPLSGCYNRRGLNQLAEREVSRAVRGKRDIAVLAIDVDFFKRINDEYGHLTGDEVIREVGELLLHTARDVDVVARFGGEEFTIVAPDSGDEGALILAERVMNAFRAHRFKSLPPDMRVTVSVGVAADLARNDEVAKTLMARADEALYVAKRNGRDRAVLWHAGLRAFDGSVASSNARRSVSGMLRVTG